ncbi:phosphatidylglycerophosphatase [Methylomagnum ishizawai]|uniref:Phosphatidylglycerophosphatase A n=1 Tax=Methylomagnum ishizawai TaxID=1760988 RepID=A0A1Y6CY55_9GAMM|nr:phosphatidylglycerophosphatase A [Methylomagnum ishizawai]SMF95170.1 phosphatidylglycerophosphatase [Methylomagnum ishizawai]
MNTSPTPNASKAKSRLRIPARRVFGDPYCFLAFGFGSGLAPVAPGTFGTLAAVPVYALVAGLAFPVYAGLVLGLFAAGVPICQRCERRLGIHDHSGIVWDEIVGFLITMAGVPFSWPAVVLGFALFRLFDVLKPWPISRLDRDVAGGFGVMLDDALAGVFAACGLHLLLPYVSA